VVCCGALVRKWHEPAVRRGAASRRPLKLNRTHHGIGFMDYRKFFGGRPYSGLMFSTRTTFPHFSVSSTMSFANSEVESERGVSPRSAIRSVILESESARLIPRCSLSMISPGVLRGAAMGGKLWNGSAGKHL
jgi:hypothetical protein